MDALPDELVERLFFFLRRLLPAKRKRAEAETLENLMFANASLKVSFKRVNASNAVCASLTAFKRFFNSSREYSKQR